MSKSLSTVIEYAILYENARGFSEIDWYFLLKFSPKTKKNFQKRLHLSQINAILIAKTV